MILGEYDGRIGMKGDCDVPDIHQRIPIDNVCNQFGDNLIEFLSDSNSCVLNGRFDSGKDNYTYVSARGRSVVDYVIVPASHLQYVSVFSVMTVTEAIDAYELIPHLQAKLPHHSLVTCSVRVSPHVKYDSTSNEVANAKPLPTSVHRRYRVDVLLPDMF